MSSAIGSGCLTGRSSATGRPERVMTMPSPAAARSTISRPCFRRSRMLTSVLSRRPTGLVERSRDRLVDNNGDRLEPSHHRFMTDDRLRDALNTITRRVGAIPLELLTQQARRYLRRPVDDDEVAETVYST